MIETQLNLFDAAVICVMLLSCLFAFFRGFVREVLSLGAWIGAALVTVYYFPDMARILKPYFKSSVGATGVGTLAIYTVALIGFSLFNALILRFLRTGKDVGMLDNALGLGFGAARGALLVSLGFFMVTIAMPADEYPDWIAKSLSKPYAERGAIALAKVAPPYLREISSLNEKVKAEMLAEGKSEDFEVDLEEDNSFAETPSGNAAPAYPEDNSGEYNQLMNELRPAR